MSKKQKKKIVDEEPKQGEVSLTEQNKDAQKEEEPKSLEEAKEEQKKDEEEQAEIPEIKLEDLKAKKKQKNLKPPKKVKIGGVTYKREALVQEKVSGLNEKDEEMIARSDAIRFKQPLTYRWLKIFGISCLIIPFLLLRIAVSVPNISDELFDAVSVVADTFALPFVIFAAFIAILKSPNKKQLILVYVILAVVIYGGLVFLFERYFITFLAALHPEQTAEEIRELANNYAIGIKIFQYNIFIDLALCTSFYYFVNATPKKIANSKKKMIAFRLCAIIPVVYFLISMILSGLLKENIIQLDVETVGLLTCRSPASYLIFFSISLFISWRQRAYLKKGGTKKGFEVYSSTKGPSLQFSIACSVIIAVVCLLDFLFGLIPGASDFAVGDSKFMFVIIPFIMFISYRKDHKSRVVDLFLPLISFLIILFLIMDTVFTLLVSS